MQTDPHVLDADHAPTPFTADEIRAGCPEGRTIRLRAEAPGQEPMVRVNRYLECDEVGALLERSAETVDGSPLGEPQADRVTWLDLQRHASFPAAITRIEKDTINTAIGELACLRYTVRADGVDQVFWFAKELPGMPIRFLTRQGDGVLASFEVFEDTGSA